MLILFDPGPVDSPPMSIRSAPSFAICFALFTAFLIELNCPPSLKESGVTFRIPMINGFFSFKSLCRFICFVNCAVILSVDNLFVIDYIFSLFVYYEESFNYSLF